MDDELVLSVHDTKAIRAVSISLSEVGLREREHLQEWVLEHPAVLGPDTMIVTAELDKFTDMQGQPERDRLDVLGLHRDGRPVVAELKPEAAPRPTVLQAMNRQPVSSVDHLHQSTGLPKPTLVRLLRTMVRAGYLTNDPRQAGYQLTSLVTSLSCGYHGDPLVVEASRAWAIKLTRQLKWPISIAVFDNDSVTVRFSTVPDSPMSPFHATINMRLSLFTRALGRAYLAFCTDEQIKAITGIT
jgi:hypothetical protein